MGDVMLRLRTSRCVICAGMCILAATKSLWRYGAVAVQCLSLGERDGKYKPTSTPAGVCNEVSLS